MTDAPHILIVDDHPDIRTAVSRYLGKKGMEVTVAEDAREMDERIAQRRPDLIVLDVMMPGETGLRACQRLRRDTDIPILLLTAMDGDADLLRGFDSGADDYMTKPFNPAELLARIKAILRRAISKGEQAPDFSGQKIAFGGVTYDADARVITRVDGRLEVLTSGEAALLCVLIAHARDVLSRDELLMKSAGRMPGPFDRTIDNQVSRLRRKIEPDVLRPRIISTVRNGGYSLSCDVEALE